MSNAHEVIMIIDFGSQYTQLIARRIRELGVYSEVKPFDSIEKNTFKNPPKGIILSGSPKSVQEPSHYTLPDILKGSIPLLGICYGMQLLAHQAKGVVKSGKIGEYGKQQIVTQGNSKIFQGIPDNHTVWMSHRDSVVRVPDTFDIIAKSVDGLISAMQHKTLQIYGLQFHPEVVHTDHGTQILSNFLDLCGCKKDWKLGDYAENVCSKIRKKVGSGRIISLVSGGVDSTVATVLCQKALGEERVEALYIDTGLMREGETEQIKRTMADQGLSRLKVVDASHIFLEGLKGVTSPELKREIIGDLFVDVLEHEMALMGLDEEDTYLCQGTLYTDLIESGKGCGNQAVVIKSHHNVNPPAIARKREAGKIIEPNNEIFKDEVRQLGKLLNIPHELLWRHPFPGPGLAVRIIGEVTKERLEQLRKADKIFLEEIQNAGLYNAIWQAFAVLLPIHTVGVMGDERTYGHVVALRAITSTDGMTAEPYHFPSEILSRIASRIVNEVQGVNRVVSDITSKPPATIEWE